MNTTRNGNGTVRSSLEALCQSKTHSGIRGNYNLFTISVWSAGIKAHERIQRLTPGKSTPQGPVRKLNAHQTAFGWTRPMVHQGQFCLLWLKSCSPRSQIRVVHVLHRLIFSTGAEDWTWDLPHAKQRICYWATASSLSSSLLFFFSSPLKEIMWSGHIQSRQERSSVLFCPVSCLSAHEAALYWSWVCQSQYCLLWPATAFQGLGQKSFSSAPILLLKLEMPGIKSGTFWPWSHSL